jgi:hypothetical protein
LLHLGISFFLLTEEKKIKFLLFTFFDQVACSVVRDGVAIFDASGRLCGAISS